MSKQSFVTGQVLTAAQLTNLQQTAMLGGDAVTKTASYVLVAADAGSTVAMTSASATTITVNTGLFAAGDTVFIQNRGSGNLTVTAGSATVATAGSLILPQNDAGILYFTATGASIFYDFIQVGAASPLTTKGDLYTFGTSDTRLAVGATNGMVLTVDSSEATGLKFATPASGGMTLLSTTTLSGASTTVSDISGSFKNLFIEVFGATWNTDQDSFMFDTNITSALSAKKINRTAVTFAVVNNTRVGSINDGTDAAKRTGGNNYIAFYFNNYASSTNYKSFTINGAYESDTANGNVIAFLGGIVSNTAMSSFTFYTNDERVFTAGTIKIFGVN